MKFLKLIALYFIAPALCFGQITNVPVGASPNNEDGPVSPRGALMMLNANDSSLAASLPKRQLNAVFNSWAVGDSYAAGVDVITNTTGQTNFSYRSGFLTSTNFSPTGLTLYFGNSSVFSAGNQTNLFLRASVEYPAGAFHALFFNGSRDVSIQPNGRVATDRLPITIPTNTQFWVRTFGRIVPGNGTFLLKELIGVNGLNGGGSIGTALSDQTMSGTISDAGQWGYGPDAITASAPNTAKAFGIWGDSIMSEKNVVGAYVYHNPCIVYAITNSYPMVNVSYSGSTASVEKTNFQSLDLISRTCSRVIVGLGVNGLLFGDSQNTISNDLQTMWYNLAANGLKVYQTTITPYSSSTDSFLTTANQTGLQTAIRAGLNDWIRTCPPPLSGVIDVGSQMETATNSNIWKADGTTPGQYTLDGIHPGTTNSQTVYINFIGPLIQAIQ